MANVRPSTAARNAQLNAIRDLIDAGAAGGRIKIYDGTQPADGDTGLSGNTLLGTLTFSGTSAANAASGVLTFSAITDDSTADATGTAEWARITDSDDNAVVDMDVAAAAASIILDTVSIVAGGVIGITSATLTAPA
jgi:hypothetical protein